MTSETIYTDKILTNAIFSGNGTITGATFSPLTNVQSFTAAGPATWTKPTGQYTMVRMECIGGGGGGGASGGGGGGGYSYAIFPYALTASPSAITVGTGGTVGNPGANSLFTFTNGVGCVGVGGSGPGAGPGGPGGGMATNINPTASVPIGGGTGAGSSGPTGTIHGVIFGGGGGGAPGQAGGSSVYGGGGGGGATSGTGGPSVFAGSGGGFGSAGTAPGGGGGSNAAGAQGSVRVITF